MATTTRLFFRGHCFDVETDGELGLDVLRSQIYSLTGVPPPRQHLFTEAEAVPGELLTDAHLLSALLPAATALTLLDDADLYLSTDYFAPQPLAGGGLGAGRSSCTRVLGGTHPLEQPRQLFSQRGALCTLCASTCKPLGSCVPAPLGCGAGTQLALLTRFACECGTGCLFAPRAGAEAPSLLAPAGASAAAALRAAAAAQATREGSALLHALASSGAHGGDGAGMAARLQAMCAAAARYCDAPLLARARAAMPVAASLSPALFASLFFVSLRVNNIILGTGKLS